MLLGDVYTPPALDRYTVVLPGTQGGVNYYGGAFDPKLGLLIANVNNLAQPVRVIRNADGSYINSGPLAGLVRFWNPSNHLPCGPTPWGELVAVDVNTGKIAWRSTLGVTDILPEGKRNTGRPGLGGAIITGSGLVFIGATDDSRFRAFDARNGKEIWTAKLPASAEATPITYAANGKQYVAVVATGGGLIGAKLASDSLVVYGLPDADGAVASRSAQPSPRAPQVSPSVKATPTVASSQLIKQLSASDLALFPMGPGRETTLRICSGCHSASVAAMQHLDSQEWNDLVQVMASRGAMASDTEFDQIAAYLAKSFPKHPPSAPPAHP
jgi:outer membrane protein assembly factor BamB